MSYPDRVEAADWIRIATELDELGCALVGPLLEPAETKEIAALYGADDRFRSTVDMARHRFGQGEYRYFAEPFPEAVVELKRALYPRLLPIARDWWTRLGRDTPWPPRRAGVRSHQGGVRDRAARGRHANAPRAIGLSAGPAGHP